MPMELQERRIQGRERRKNRFGGLTFTQWGLAFYPLVVWYIAKLPLLMGTVFFLVNFPIVLWYTETQRPGALRDLVEYYLDVLVHGGREYAPTRTDPKLRLGDTYFAPSDRK